MKILLWSQYFWPENFRINELANALVQSGMQVTVLTGKPNYPEGQIFPGYRIAGVQRELHAGAEVVRIPLLPRGSGSALKLVFNYLSFIFSGLIFAPPALRRKHFDIVFVYAPSPLLQALPAILLARLKRAPLFVWVQDLWPESLAATGFVKSRWALGMVEALVRYIYRRSDVILIQSEAFREPVTRLTDDPRKIFYFPNTAEAMDTVQFASANAELVTALGKFFSIVFAGNIGVAQSVETIIEAADCLRAYEYIRFFVIGSGSREIWLREEIARRKLDNVILVGRLPYAEMPAIFAASAALLVTLTDNKTFALTVPSKLQSYFSAGRPILACLNGEGARIVSEAKAGITSPAGDGSALADSIRKLAALDPDERQRLGDNGLRYFKANFEPGRRVSELIEYFKNVAVKNREASPK